MYNGLESNALDGFELAIGQPVPSLFKQALQPPGEESFASPPFAHKIRVRPTLKFDDHLLRKGGAARHYEPRLEAESCVRGRLWRAPEAA